MSGKFKVEVVFETRYHKKLFEHWMSNLGEQLFERQLDVEREMGEIPKNLQEKGITFSYPKSGLIKVQVTEE